jgi:hypothetical protein
MANILNISNIHTSKFKALDMEDIIWNLNTELPVR